MIILICTNHLLRHLIPSHLLSHSPLKIPIRLFSQSHSSLKGSYSQPARMSTTAATFTPVVASTKVLRRSSKPRATKVSYITGLNSFGGLKAQNTSVSSLGLPVSTEQSFAKIVSSLRSDGIGGGGLSAQCNAVAEIFKIAAIMNGLVLVGVAVGFVLLRVEAFVEEAE